MKEDACGFKTLEWAERESRLGGDHVFINGKEVIEDGAAPQDHAQESEAGKQAREALEGRYPNVKFIGDCSKINVDEGVEIEAGVMIDQSDEAVIALTGKSAIREGACISISKSSEISLGSCSIGNQVTIISGTNAVISSGGISIGAIHHSSDQGIRINNTEVGPRAEISGLSVVLENSTVLQGCKVSSAGSGEITIDASRIEADVVCSGSGDISIEGSRTAAEIQVCGSGDIEVSNSSTVEGPVKVMGSGDVKIRNATVTPAASLSVMGSGDIIAKDCTASRPYSVIGHQTIKI